MMTTAIPRTVRVPHFGGERAIGWSTREVAAPGAGELLVEVKANALCGSERGQWERGSTVVPGHEVVGVVAAVGPDTTLAPGTNGVVYLMVYCGACRSCRLGFTNQCLERAGDVGFNRDGGYGPFVVVPERIFHPIDPDTDPVDATLLLDIMGTGGHAIARARLVHPDPQSLLVMGAGPMGLGVLAMAKLVFGADFPIAIADVAPYRLALAEQLGGKIIDLRSTALDAGVRDHGIVAPDLAIDTSGRTEARRGAMDLLAQRGVLVCVGHGGELPLVVSPDLIANERAVLGSEYFRWDEIAPNIVRLREHAPYLSQIVTHTFPVAEIDAAFDLFMSGNAGKVVVTQ